MKKHYLVLHEKAWMKNELVPNRRLEPFCTFVFGTRDFSRAPYIKTKEGSKIDEAWLLKFVGGTDYLKGYDGLVVMLEGERLAGRNGVHTKKTYNGRRFSMIQMEAKRGVYRVWEEEKGKTWTMASTKRRTKDAVKQVVYTFDHEIAHSLAWLYGFTCHLHTFIKQKRYEDWWAIITRVIIK